VQIAFLEGGEDRASLLRLGALCELEEVLQSVVRERACDLS
jgi:hypothetical protein